LKGPGPILGLEEHTRVGQQPAPARRRVGGGRALNFATEGAQNKQPEQGGAAANGGAENVNAEGDWAPNEAKVEQHEEEGGGAGFEDAAGGEDKEMLDEEEDEEVGFYGPNGLKYPPAPGAVYGREGEGEEVAHSEQDQQAEEYDEEEGFEVSN
jgi:hypothetical protein